VQAGGLLRKGGAQALISIRAEHCPTSQGRLVAPADRRATRNIGKNAPESHRLGQPEDSPALMPEGRFPFTCTHLKTTYNYIRLGA